MELEFKGSLLLFAALALTAGMRRQWPLFLTVAVVFVSFKAWPYAEFLLGGFLCIEWSKQRRSIFGINSWPYWVGLPFVLLLAGPGRMLLAKGQESNLDGFEAVNLAIGAAGVVTAAVFWPSFQAVLSNRLFLWLGKISFPLYLFHLPILLSAGACLYCILRKSVEWGHSESAIASCVVTIGLSVLVATVCAVTVEPLSINVGLWIYRRFFEPKRLEGLDPGPFPEVMSIGRNDFKEECERT